GALIIDVTTAPPAGLAAAAGRLAKDGVGLVDGAIMGSITLSGARTPLLLAGAGADKAAEWLAAHGFRCTTLANAQVGDASALKLLRSLFTKGLEALTVECLLAAESRGLRQQLLEQLAVVDETPFTEYLEVLVTSHLVHARRRLAEVEAVGEELARQ